MNSFIHVHRKREENLLAQPYYIQRLFTVTTHQLRAPSSFILLFFPLSNIHVFPSYYYFSFCLTLSATWMWSCRRLIISRRIPRSTCSFFYTRKTTTQTEFVSVMRFSIGRGFFYFFSSLSSSLTIEAPYLSFKGLSVWPPVGRHFVAVVFLFYPNNNMKKTLVPSSLQRPPDHRRVISILLTCSGRRDTTKKLPPVFFFIFSFYKIYFSGSGGGFS